MNEDLWIIQKRRERELQLNIEIRTRQKPGTGKLPPVGTGGLPPVRDRNGRVAV